MEIVILILCIFMLFISGASCAVTVLLWNKIKNTKDSSTPEIKNLREDILNELSRNRNEQNHLNHTQRTELSESLDKVSKNIEQLSQTNSNQLTAMYRDMFSKLNEIRDRSSEDTQKQNEKIQASLEKIRESNEKKLDEMRTVVDEKLTATLTERLDSSFKTVSEQLTNLYKALGEMKEMSGGITEHVSTLNRVLTNVKARGTWAEVQLKNILDQTIPQMYVENYAPSERSKDRVEFAIKIPSGENYSEITYLPLDSKFPIEDYIRLCEAADRADKEGLEKARRELEDRVLHEARTIAKYINVPKTTPFAIMYLATEGLYAEIVSSQNGLVERIQREYNIMIAGPTTITALLNSLSMGFKIAAINEKANEVRKILSAVKGQYDTFGALLDKAKKKIDEAGMTLDKAQHRSSIIQKKLKSIEAVGASEADAFLDMSNNDGYELSDEDKFEDA
ncbi:MAG: DNA recombination protein RmuC [Ruminococcaceae bacterium]|nr:DNA recombination protein RmuC [Oscillospiraceae bacterium]